MNISYSVKKNKIKNKTMDVEEKMKTFLIALALVFALLAYFSYFYSFVALFLVTALIIIEIYFRIQHNIDKKADRIIYELEKRILDSQRIILKDVKNLERAYEDSVDFLEVLMNYLEDLKNNKNETK